MERYDELKKGESGALVSIAAYLVLSAIKLIIGYLFHSEALTADGLNNTTDIIASVAVLIGMRISQSLLTKIIHTSTFERKRLHRLSHRLL